MLRIKSLFLVSLFETCCLEIHGGAGYNWDFTTICGRQVCLGYHALFFSISGINFVS